MDMNICRKDREVHTIYCPPPNTSHIDISPILIAIVSGISGNGTERLPIAVEYLRVEHVLQRKVPL